MLYLLHAGIYFTAGKKRIPNTTAWRILKLAKD